MVNVGFRLDFAPAKKVFVTQNASIQPKIHIDDIRIYVMAVLLDNSALSKINVRLAQSGGLQMPFMAYVTKSYWYDISFSQKKKKNFIFFFYLI